MAQAKASAMGVGIPARKTRLVADLIRGKKVGEARAILEFTRKASAPVIRKVLDSAVANAENRAAERRERIDTDEMVVLRIEVGEGRTIRRFQPSCRGRALPIRKRSSHIRLEIGDK
jgi:large subunit ribosomal protein L22